MTDKEILEVIKKKDWSNLRSSQVVDVSWLIEQSKMKQDLEELINTHEPHGRNYTNEQYVKLRLKSQQLEANLEDCMSRYVSLEEELSVKHKGFMATIEEVVQYATLSEKYYEAVKKIEQIYKDNSKKYPSEYESGYLDGLDKALGLLEEVEERNVPR